MVEVNQRIAQFLGKSYCGHSIRRRHLKCLEPKLDMWLKKYKQIIPQSGTLKYAMRCLNYAACIIPASQEPVLINSHVKQVLENAIQEHNLSLARHVLSAERLHPQISLAILSFNALSMNAEYEVCPPDRQDRQNCEVAHHGLHMGAYVHFTSPLHRYVDIVTHR